MVLATIYAIRGLLLEEVLLNLLKESGYSTITEVGNDITLNQGHSGIEVKGRGWNHQIDAIADFLMTPPFSYPIRLLLEAKFYTSQDIGINVIRNAVGVLKDVNEYWVSNNEISKHRFHYQYAVFTSSSFSTPAQKYAFAQDIYLIKLENNKYFLPIINSIKDLKYNDFNGNSVNEININLSELRYMVRESLKSYNRNILSAYISNKNFERSEDKFYNLYNSSINLSRSFLGMIGRRFPIFLTPSPSFNIEELILNPSIRICWDDNYWYIIKNSANCRALNEEDILFSFDLPDELFKLYEDNNMLTESRALDMKEELMSTIQIIFKNSTNSILSQLELKLDNEWIQNIRERINSRE